MYEKCRNRNALVGPGRAAILRPSGRRPVLPMNSTKSCNCSASHRKCLFFGSLALRLIKLLVLDRAEPWSVTDLALRLMRRRQVCRWLSRMWRMAVFNTCRKVPNSSRRAGSCEAADGCCGLQPFGAALTFGDDGYSSSNFLARSAKVFRFSSILRPICHGAPNTNLPQTPSPAPVRFPWCWPGTGGPL